jgi:beta-1,4-mannosyl-glycoprotein beta-1,4-N-acetylglucosaminyltransferase
MFNDEIEILSSRLEYLENIIDFFVVAESNLTFSGAPKPFHLDSILTKLEIDTSRIIRVRYEIPSELLAARATDGNNWPLEQFGRNSLLSVMNKLPDTATVMLSDVDEIPSINQIEMGIKAGTLVSIVTPLHYGRLNWLSPDGKNWNTVKIGPASAFRGQNLNQIKHVRCRLISGDLGGHYSDQFSSFNDVTKKMNNSAHSDYQQVQELHNLIFLFANRFRVNHFGRFDRKGVGLIQTQSREELNEFQARRLSTSPELFDFSRPQKSFILRFIASYLVTKAWEKKEIQRVSEPLMYFRLPAALTRYIKSRFFANLKRAGRVISRITREFQKVNRIDFA